MEVIAVLYVKWTHWLAYCAGTGGYPPDDPDGDADAKVNEWKKIIFLI